MKQPSQAIFGAAVFLSAFCLCPLQGQLIHRYSFNDPAGDATDAVLTDSIGGAHGVVQGADALFTGTGLDLPGGSSDTAAYGDLPNGLISSHTAVTIEGWVTVDNDTLTWARIFDFGSTEGDTGTNEITGPGNTNGEGTAGLDYFFLSATIDGDYGSQRVEVRNEDPTGGGIYTFDSVNSTIVGEQIHFAVTWEDTGAGTSKINYWRNGVQMTVNGVVNTNLANLNDVNNWLGRSTWLGDSNADVTFDEFRIYDEALSDDQITITRDAGPDTIIDFQDDPDGDQMPSSYEDLYDFLDPNDGSDGVLDEDNDGLNNLGEYLAGTKPDDDDSDEDGLSDGDEVNVHSTDPLDVDSDADGLTDGEEVNTTHTSPLNVDSDEDGLDDKSEVVAGEDPTSAASTAPTLIHRYAFNAPEGGAPETTTIPDLIGGQDGSIVGAGALLTGTALSFPGGDGATSDGAYLDFPNGLISSLDSITFEAWYTIHGASVWTHFWNFGSSDLGELTTGGSTAGPALDAFFFSHARDGNIDTLRVGSNNADPEAPGGGTGSGSAGEQNYDYGDVSSFDQEYHVAATWISDGSGGGHIVVYRNGVLVGSRATSFTARDINDVNNWLGRSNWTGDEYFQGEANEFRIYNGVMNSAAAAASYAAGPDAASGGEGLEITSLDYDASADTFTITFTSIPGRAYAVYSSTDLIDFSNEVEDLQGAGTTTTVGPFANPSPGAPKLFFRVSE